MGRELAPDDVCVVIDSYWSARTLPLNDSKAADSRLFHSPYSHSIVPGGLLVTSYTTRFTPLTSLTIRAATLPSKAMSNGKKSAVMPSLEVTARRAQTWS